MEDGKNGCFEMGTANLPIAAVALAKFSPESLRSSDKLPCDPELADLVVLARKYLTHCFRKELGLPEEA